MAISECRHVALALLCILPTLYSQYIENLSIVPLKMGGLKVSIKDVPNLNYFEFQGLVNKPLEFGEIGDIIISAMTPTNGFWSSQDDNVELKVGDVIHYYLHLGFRNRSVYDLGKQSYTVRELYDPEEKPQSKTTSSSTIENRFRTTTAPPRGSCGKTITEVNTRVSSSTNICSGQIIFEDNFDTLQRDLWTVEQYIPSEPEYPFVSYQSLAVSVKDGILRIEPQLQENFPGFDSAGIIQGSLNLTMGCTRRGFCVYESSGALILPPIASGRITSTRAFAFKYGFIELRAKVPQGDWLFPDILLETKFYGDHDNRVIRIVGVRGNKLLAKGTEESGNKVLYGGPMVDVECRNLLVQKVSTAGWGNDFHVYSISWTPDMITLLVDGEEWGRVNLTPSDLLPRLSKDTCGPLQSQHQPPVTSFNDFFGITLGVSAGGILEFPEGIISGLTMPKPWTNRGRKLRLNFYQAKSTWLPTWSEPALLVDYIRVRAL